MATKLVGGLALGALLSAGCAPVPVKVAAPVRPLPPPMPVAAAPAEKAELPAWYREAQAREAKGLRPVSVRAPQGAYSASVLTNGKVAFDPKDPMHLLVELSGTTMECFVGLRERHPLAQLRGWMANLAEVSEQRFITRHALGSLGPVAFVHADVEYVVKEDGRPVAGALKTSTFVNGPHSVFCAHEQLGYRESFDKAAASFAQSLTTEDGADEGELRSMAILVTSTQELAITLGVHRELVLAGGEVVTDELTLTAFPRSRSELMVSDAREVVASGSDGVVRRIQIDRGGQDDDGMLLDVKRVRGDTYEVHGTLDGKPLDGSFTATPSLFAGWYRERSSEGAPRPTPAYRAYATYDPRQNPLGITLVKHKQGVRGSFETEAAGVRTAVTPLPGARPRMRVKTGGQVLEVEQVYGFEAKARR